jgi:quinol monooxygenase YgiN
VSDEVVVVATFHALPGKADAVEAELQDAIVRTHEEPGCIRYALHRSLDGGDVVMFIERWESREALAAHGQQPYITRIGEALAGLTTGPVELHFLEPRPAGDPVTGVL